MTLGVATVDDLEAICVLENTGFEASERWSVTSWQAEIGREQHQVFVHRAAVGLDGVGCFSVLDDTAELLRVIVAPTSRGHGLGTTLVEAGQSWARQAGARRMMLEVRHDNESALAVYRATGFIPIARRNDYYGTGRHAVVMECQL